MRTNGMAPNEQSLRFVPSRVDGLAGVTEVVVYPDRLEIVTAKEVAIVRFIDIANWCSVWSWFYRQLARRGWLLGTPYVADRDWFHPPADRYFRFFSTPPITIYLPDEPAETDYTRTMFRRVQDVIAAGGFCTFDLG